MTREQISYIITLYQILHKLNKFVHCIVQMADLLAERQQRGVSSASIVKLKTKVNEWIAKGGLTAVDVLSVEQAKAHLHTFDTKFKWHHINVIVLLDKESEMDREEAVTDEHETESLSYLLASKDFFSQ